MITTLIKLFLQAFSYWSGAPQEIYEIKASDDFKKKIFVAKKSKKLKELENISTLVEFRFRRREGGGGEAQWAKE